MEENMVLTLDEMLKKHRQNNKDYFGGYKFKGEVELFLRDNEDNSLISHVKQENLQTRVLGDDIVRASEPFNIATTVYVFVSNDTNEVHPSCCLYKASYTDSNNIGKVPSYSINFAARTWTFTASAWMTTTDRTINIVGLCGRIKTQFSYSQSARAVFCATKLSTPIIQLSTNSLEVIYRWAFTRVS